MPVHLRPSAPTAPDAILCGDPARALAIAQELLVEPRMSNHHRGLWGYHGRTAAGRELTVQATGIGGPSAAVVLRELAALGTRRAIRVGTCVAPLADGIPLGGTVAVSAAIAADGASLAYGSAPEAALLPDPALAGALERAIGGAVPVRSADLYYRPGPPPQHPATVAPVEDLQTAALFAAGADLGIRLAAGLVVAVRAGVRLEDEPLERSALALAAVATDVLAAQP
jgi:uridine phosphorylase